MKREKILTKDGKPYVTQDGVELEKNTLEFGDTFIPKLNNVHITENKVGDKVYKKYSIIADLKDKNDKLFKEVFIVLTPTQAKTLQTCLKDNGEINQCKWKTYSYTNEYGNQIGITNNQHKEALKFKDEE